MFFLRRTQPLALGAAQLRALRLSLNTPVVSTSDLPVGPARAAIVVHQESKPGLALTVGVRSMNTGAVVLYGLQGVIAPEAAAEGVDAALAFAEGMGFLFDDELIDGTPEAAEKALARWQDAIGEGAESITPGAESITPGAESITPGGEELAADGPIDLFDLASRDLTDPPVEAPTPEPDAAGFDFSGMDDGSAEVVAGEDPLDFQPDPEPVATPPLTKFRPRADPVPGKLRAKTSRRAENEAPRADAEAPRAEAEAPRAPKSRPKRQALARLRLARRRPTPMVQDARRGWLLRLLTSF